MNVEKAIEVLKHLDGAPDRDGHHKKYWWCPECGDDLAKALAFLDTPVDKVVIT